MRRSKGDLFDHIIGVGAALIAISAGADSH
jgi:hypothetical protein